MPTLQMSDHQLIYYQVKQPKNPKGVIQLVHGSCEHSGRYTEFINYFVSQGFVVYAQDHRGHGKTATSTDAYGYFGETDGWQRLVDDLKAVNDVIRQSHETLPIVMVGHSMGSFLARHYAQLYGQTLSGLILSGTAHQPRAILHLGCAVAKLLKRLKGTHYRSNLLNTLSYGQFNREFKPSRTTHDWLSQDETVVDLFLQDEACGFTFTTSGFYDMFTGLLAITDQHQIKKIPKQLPVLFISGENDPVGGNGQMVKKAARLYKELGIEHVTLKLYPAMRHEIFNEFEKEKVYQDMREFIEYSVLQ